MSACLPPIFVSGEKLNAIGRGTLTGPAIDALTDITWVYDRFTSRPILCTSYATSGNCDFVVDLDLVKGVTAPVTLSLRAGEGYTLTFASGAKGKLQSSLTGLYLQADGTWTTTATELTVNIDFYTQKFEVVNADYTSFVFTLTAGAIANVRLWPWIDIMAIFGHDLMPMPDTIQWDAANDSGISSGVTALLAASAPPVAVDFCKPLSSPNKQRYHRVRIISALRKPSISEVILTQKVFATTGATAFGRTAAPPIQTSEGIPQSRFDTRWGTMRAFAEGISYSRAVSTRAHLTAAEYPEFVATVLRRSQYGLWPTLMVPNPSQAFPTEARLIRVPEHMEWEENPVDVFTAGFAYSLSPPPIVIP